MKKIILTFVGILTTKNIQVLLEAVFLVSVVLVVQVYSVDYQRGTFPLELLQNFVKWKFSSWTVKCCEFLTWHISTSFSCLKRSSQYVKCTCKISELQPSWINFQEILWNIFRFCGKKNIGCTFPCNMRLNIFLAVKRYQCYLICSLYTLHCKLWLNLQLYFLTCPDLINNMVKNETTLNGLKKLHPRKR